MGNTVVWKPATSAALSNYFVLELLEAGGLPLGVINFVPGDAKAISDAALASRSLAGIHFTGSTDVFDLLWRSTRGAFGLLSDVSAADWGNGRQEFRLGSCLSSPLSDRQRNPRPRTGI
jgi:hypothetical protein